MIHTSRIIMVSEEKSTINSPIILYRGDREVEIEFTINGHKFMFTNGGNVIKSINATHGQLVINTPAGYGMFSEVSECRDGKVIFIITKEMIDELDEVGFYDFQIRLFDGEERTSRVTIPPVHHGIDIREPMALEEEQGLVDMGEADFATINGDDPETEGLDTFLPDDSYNKTNWEKHDVISKEKLNKIEDAIYTINERDLEEASKTATHQDVQDAKILDLENRTTTLENKTTNLDDLNDKTIDLENRTNTIENKVTSLEGKTINLEGKTATLESKVTTLESKTTTLENETTSLKGRTTDLENKTTTLESKTTTLEDKATVLENKTTTLEDKTATLENETTDLKNRTTNLEVDSARKEVLIQALLNEKKDKVVTVKANGNNKHLDYAIDDWLIKLNKIEGETLVNVCDQKDSIPITKSYTVEDTNHVPLQGEYDGKARPVVYGNTLVNHNADWDDNLQTGIEISTCGTEDVQVEGTKGQEVSVVLEGNTVLNHALGKTAGVVTDLTGDKHTQSGTGNISTATYDFDGKVEVQNIKGNTLVNHVVDGAKEFNLNGNIDVEGTNVTITDTVDNGLVNVVCEGTTMVNLVELDTTMYNGNALEWIQGNYIVVDNPTTNGALFFKFKYVKPNTVYTVCFEVLSVFDNGAKLSLDLFPDEYSELPYQNTIGFKYFTFTTPDDVSTLKYFRYYVSDTRVGICKLTYPMVFEGDLTQTPELIPTEYFEGMKSVGECEDNKIEILSQNKNFVEVSQSKIRYKWQSQCTILSNGGIEVRPTATTGVSYVRIGSYKLKKGSRYIFNDNGSGNIRQVLVWTGENGTGDYTDVDITKPLERDMLVDIAFYIDNNSLDNVATFYPQIEMGDISTNQVSHTLNKKEITLSEPLRALPNGVKDKIVKIGGKWYVERNCGEVVLDGSENWVELVTDYDNVWQYATSRPSNSIQQSMFLCDHFVSDVENKGIMYTGYLGGSNINLVVPHSDLDSFKQWLQTNPTTVVYQLTSPYYEELPIDPTVNTYNDITHISNNSTIPCNMKITDFKYNTVALKANTQYTLQSNLGTELITTPEDTTNYSILPTGNKGDLVKDVMLLEGNLTQELIPTEYVEGLKSSFELEENKVDVKVVGTYKEDSYELQLNSPLLKDDEIKVQDGWLGHYHKMGMVVLDGSEDWEMFADIGKFYSRCIDNYAKDTSISISDKFANRLSTGDTIKIGGGLAKLSVHKLDKYSVSEFKQWLQANPTTVVYELAEPYYEPLIQVDSLALDIYNTNSTITINSAVPIQSHDLVVYDIKYDTTEGNYITINTESDCSTMIKTIEGRTMVNVCNQKDPIAITKSYTVENSGNHIALQGEYDGSCRPVIQGNTMVNLANVSTKYTTETHGYIHIESSMYKVNTVYTVIFKNLPDGLHWVMTDRNNNWMMSSYTTSNLQIATTESSLTDEFVIHITRLDDSSFIGEDLDTMRNSLMIFEGDLTQTPELIPTEYVEGLKSSFEDGYIPENELVDFPTDIYLNGTSYQKGNGDGCDVYFHTVSLKTNTVYTVFCNINEETTCTNGVGLRLVFDSTDKHYDIIAGDLTGMKGIFCSTFTFTNTLRETDNLEIWNRENGVVSISNMTILEGDWTHLTEEDFNNLGKYKVEYKVTGKNLLNSSAMIDGKYQNHNLVSGDFSIVDNSEYSITEFIRVKPSTNYVTDIGTGAFYRIDKTPITHSDISSGNFTTPSDCYYVVLITRVNNDKSVMYLEEGSEATEYEPYKEYTKTFYLNSPLLEGDTIEDVNGVATHVKRYGKVVLDGSENWDNYSIAAGSDILTIGFRVIINNIKNYTLSLCDKFPASVDNKDNYLIYTIDKEQLNCYNDRIYIRISKSKLTTLDINGFKQWLSENPTTVVYELASPIYEPISTESILCDSYVNGHLDVNTNIPIEKVMFKGFGKSLVYSQPSANYILQFNSDNVGIIDYIDISGTAQTDVKEVTKGINKFNIKTPSNSEYSWLAIYGIGFNASNIVVTEAIDADFDYFEGLKSSYECEVTEDGKYKVDVKVTGKNLFDINSVEAGYIQNGTLLGGWSGYSTSDFILCNSDNYCLSRSEESIGETLEVVFYDKNYNYINHTFMSSTGNLTKLIRGELLLPSKTKYLKISYVSTNLNIQLEEGTEATSYEPYFESTKTFYLNSPLLEGDKIVAKNGKVYHYHKMGKVVLDGSEGSAHYGESKILNDSGTYYKCYVRPITIDEKAMGNVISNMYPTVAHNDTENFGIRIPSSLGIYMSIPASYEGSLQEFCQANPTTAVYELASPYYELIDEYNNTILNIPNTVAHLTHTSAVPVNNTVFTNYKDELNVLEPNTQYRLMFDCDTANIPFTVTLGGTSQEVTSKKGTHSLLITTPSELVDKNLVIDGIGRCGIDNIRIFKGDVEYDYVKGLWSGYEERKIENLFVMDGYWGDVSSDRGNCAYMKQLKTLHVKPNTEYTVVLYNTPSNYVGYQMYTLSNKSGETLNTYGTFITVEDINKAISYLHVYGKSLIQEDVEKIKIVMLEGDWTDNPPTYEEVMANEGKYAVKVKLDTNATIFGKGGRL